jgi:hypothetical protein
MRGHTDRAVRGLVRIRVVMGNTRNCQPDGQQQAQPAHCLYDGPHGLPRKYVLRIYLKALILAIRGSLLSTCSR